MSLSDCLKCWDTPCMCGYNYRDWTDKRKLELINAVTHGSIKAKEEEALEKTNPPKNKRRVEFNKVY